MNVKNNSAVAIVVFSSRLDFNSMFKKIQCQFNFDFFAPIFGVEDINSSALSVIGFAEI